MERSAAEEPAQPDGKARPQLRRDLSRLLLLLLLAAGLRTWIVWHTEVMSRDSIIFIDYALQLETRPWPEVLRHNHQHPGYPLAVLAVSLPVRYVFGATDPVTMQLSAQLASALAGVLLVIPMFYLGKELFDRGIAFWGTLLFQCLPVSGLILSDGISDALFLLFALTALLAAVRGLRSRSPVGFALCGLCAGLAYLTRPEGVVIVAAPALLLFWMQWVPAWRRGWCWTLTAGASLMLVALAAGGPYALTIGGLTNKPSGKGVVHAERPGDSGAGEVQELEETGEETRAPGLGGPPLALAVWLNRDLSLPVRLVQGLLAVVGEVVKGFHYVAWLPALLGLWWYRDRLRSRPEAWLLALLCVLYLLVLWRLAVVAGYVSERHVLLPVLCGLFLATAGIRELPGRLAAWRGKGFRIPGGAATWSLLLLAALAGAGLCKTLRPLHGNRAGHHAAGLWLSAHTQQDDEICDGHFGWAYFYSGRLFLPGRDRDGLPRQARTRYVIKGSSKERVNPYGPTNSRADMTLEEIRKARGTIAYHWPPELPEDRAKVVVWRVKMPAAASH